MERSFQPVVVVGNGWAALASAAFAAKVGHPVTWIQGTGRGLIAPLPALGLPPTSATKKEGALTAARETLARLSNDWDLSAGEGQEAIFLREFRNKSFREPRWAKEDAKAASQARAELWGAERFLACAHEVRFDRDLLDLDDALRAVLPAAGVRVIEGVPLAAFKGTEAVLASGDAIPVWRLIYAGAWNECRGMVGLG
ncbi:MAG TPA: hypothetical protein VL588_10330, partial [Bdellovibrionota bacterium]|nr:hypothetical protein [Bdellovibrionota bacterium]